MNQGTYPLAASMINQINRLDMISNNLANTNTNGFKQEGISEGSFNHYLQKAQEQGIVPLKINEVTNTIPKMDGKFINGEQGPIMPTGNTLDFALNKSDTFFKVQDPSGEVLYTRDGAFKNLDGFLVNSNGHYILNNDNEPISTEEEFVSQIAVVKIDYKELDKYKDNNFKSKEGAFIEGIELNDSEIHQGAIERSNVNSVTSMIGLIDAHRRFEQAQKAVSTIDELNGKLIDKIGNNTRS